MPNSDQQLTTSPLRFALIGAGANIFKQHRTGVAAVGGVWAGVVDINAAVGQARATKLGCPFFSDYRTMLAEAQPDVVAIITPHPFHAEQTIASLEAGSHVLVEKPMAVHVQQADAMIAAAEQSGRVLAVNFQQRLRPEIIAARHLIENGQLGEIQNADMKMTWTRTATYFQQSPWRGTWIGEGGGVLLNQAPHELDLLCYLLGMPARVFAWTRNLIHHIETEDTIQAMLEWPNGALGSIHISTAEAGQPQRFEIIGTGGRLALGSGQMQFHQFETDVREFIKISDDSFGAPDLHPVPVTAPDGTGDHAAIYRDLVRAITTGTAPTADGPGARMSLELANAINFASYRQETVEFPLDRARYVALFTELCAAG